ncbi:MAG: hypothetical protein ACYTFW_21995 [Planctomycetota bacterium]
MGGWSFLELKIDALQLSMSCCLVDTDVLRQMLAVNIVDYIVFVRNSFDCIGQPLSVFEHVH